MAPLWLHCTRTAWSCWGSSSGAVLTRGAAVLWGAVSARCSALICAVLHCTLHCTSQLLQCLTCLTNGHIFSCTPMLHTITTITTSQLVGVRVYVCVRLCAHSHVPSLESPCADPTELALLHTLLSHSRRRSVTPSSHAGDAKGDTGTEGRVTNMRKNTVHTTLTSSYMISGSHGHIGVVVQPL